MSDDAAVLVHCDHYCLVSCGDPSIGGSADRRQQSVQSNRAFQFWGKPNRFESRIGTL